MLLKIRIALGEVMITEPPSPIGRKWRWVNRLQNQVFLLVYKDFLASCISTPKNEHNVFLSVGNSLYDGIREGFPTMFLVRACHMFTNSKGSVEKKDSLLCPSAQ